MQLDFVIGLEFATPQLVGEEFIVLNWPVHCRAWVT